MLGNLSMAHHVQHLFCNKRPSRLGERYSQCHACVALLWVVSRGSLCTLSSTSDMCYNGIRLCVHDVSTILATIGITTTNNVVLQGVWALCAHSS